ncbi:MAG TPA: protease inhibitor I42 family protein [Longimicrobium sp.]|jgi:inhibitor of cysteine peptidase|nr:protease inhibitor I42 family protein [Longimicrobium sp.]
MSRNNLALLVIAFGMTTGCDHRPSFHDPAQPIEVRAGGEFELALQSNHSTGYEWVLVDSAALGPVRLTAKHYAIPRRNRDRNGAGGTERWIFRAEGPGNGVVALAYKRPWETRPPADSARFRVTVR